MEVKIEYQIILDQRCAQATVDGHGFTARGDTWEEAKNKLLGQIRDYKAIEAPPPSETVEI